MSEENSLPAAGWYPDPADSSRIRWWDGQQWTQHVAVSGEAAPSMETNASPAAPALAGRNVQTKLVLWAGLFVVVALWALSTLITTMN